MNPLLMERPQTFGSDWSGNQLETEPNPSDNAAELRDENRRLRRVINRLRAERQTLCDALRKTW